MSDVFGTLGNCVNSFLKFDASVFGASFFNYLKNLRHDEIKLCLNDGIIITALGLHQVCIKHLTVLFSAN